MNAAHFIPNSQLLLTVLLLAILVVGSANAFGFELHYDGDVLCRIGTAQMPVKHAEVKLMEEDFEPLFDPDDHLATTQTDANGAFSVDGFDWEMSRLEPYLLIKVCRNANDESSCNVKKIMVPYNLVHPQRGIYFLDDDFCQHLCNGGECQSA